MIIIILTKLFINYENWPKFGKSVPPPPSEASKIGGGGAQAPQALPPRTGYARDRKKRSGIQIQRKNRF